MNSPDLHCEENRLIGLESVALGTAPPPALRVINLRRRGIDQFTISLPTAETTVNRGWGLRFPLFRRRSRRSVVQSITIVGTRLKFTYSPVYGGSLHHQSVESKDIDAIVIRPASSRSQSSVVIFYGIMDAGRERGRIEVGAGLPEPALVWLRDRLLLEVAGLVSKPLYNIGRRSTRETVNPDEELYSRWPRGPNRLIECYLDTAPQHLKALCDAIEGKAWTDASTHVHWLKSSSAAVAARYLSELFQRVELKLMEEDFDGTEAMVTHIDGEFTKVCACLNMIIHSEGAHDGGTSADGSKTHQFRSEHAFPEKKILLVEDSRVNQELALDLLQQLGCIVDCVENGEDAVKRAETEHYDLILMDCQMPGMGGLEATRRIRQSERKRGTGGATIVALTAHTLLEDRNNCLAAGMNDHLGKPFLPEDFVAVLSRWLGPTSRLDCSAAEAGEPAESPVESDPEVLDFYPVDRAPPRRRDAKKTWSAVDKRIWPKFQ